MKLTEAYLQVLAEEDKKKAPPFAKDTDKDDDGEGMDPVGKEDGDVDNDGDKDESDVYLKKRRDTIKKASKKDDAKGDAEAVEESSDSMQRGGKKAAANIAAAGKDKAIQRGAAKKVRELRKKGKSADLAGSAGLGDGSLGGCLAEGLYSHHVCFFRLVHVFCLNGFDRFFDSSFSRCFYGIVPGLSDDGLFCPLSRLTFICH